MNNGSVQMQEISTEVPFALEKDLIIVNVTLSGKEYRFILDTGAPNVVSPELAKILSKKQQKEFNVVDSGGKKNDLQFINIDCLEMFGISFHNTTAAVANLRENDALSCYNVDGLLGANLLRLCPIEIDYINQILRFHKYNLPENKNLGIEVTFKNSMQGTPYIQLKIGESTHKIMVDSGYTGFLTLQKEKADELNDFKNLKRNETIGITTSGLFGNHNADTNYSLPFKSFSIEEQEIAAEGIINFEKAKSELLGNSFLRQFNISFDWKNKKMYLQPNAFKAPQTEGYGFTFVRDEGQLKVAALTKGQFLHEAGVELGDLILQIETRTLQDLTSKDICELSALLSKKPKTIFLRIQNKGEIREFNVPLRPHF